MKSVQKRLFSLFLSACLIVGLFSFLNTSEAVFGEETKKPPIKVAFAADGGLAYKDEFGNYSGYTYDYLQEIAQYTGWEYEFIQVEGSTNEAILKMLDMLSKGEVDLLGEMIKNTDTQAKYDFPEYSYGHTYKTLSALENNQDINDTNFMTKKGLKIAAYKNAVVTNKQLDDFCRLSNISYTIVECESEEEIMDALEAGRADIAVGSDLTPVKGTKTIAKFSATPFYFGITKGNSTLINELNTAILTINKVKPFFEKDLYTKHLVQTGNDFFLTEDEAEYIQQGFPVEVAAVSSVAPLQFKDGESLKGIIVDVLRMVSEKTGLTFACTPVNSFADAFELLEQGKVSAISGIPYNYEISQEHNLIMSSNLVSSQMVLVAKNVPGTSLLNKTIGVIENLTSPMLDNGSRTESYDTFEACLDDVINGKIDFAYINLYSAEYYTSFQKYSDLRIIPQSAENPLPFCLGIKRGTDPLLVSIINKALASISSKDLETIIFQTTTDVEQKVTFKMFLEQNPYIIVWICVVAFVMLASIIIFMFRRKMNNSRQLDIENQRYLQLCELASEYIYEYDVKKDLLLFSQSFAKRFNFPLRLENYQATFNGKVKPKGNFNQDILSRIQPLYQNLSSEFITECNCKTSNGEYRWYRNTLAEIKDQNGETIYLVGKLTDIQKEKEEKERLERSALTDGMTGLYNIVAFKNAVDLKLKGIKQKAALIIVDIDKFKGVNDKLGHYVGDTVLKDFATVIKRSICESDIAGRLGGDEFMIFVEDIGDCEKISAFCSKLCKAARREYISEEGVACLVTVSLGAVLISETSDFSTIYKHADQQLYIAKTNGRNCYSVADCD